MLWSIISPLCICICFSTLLSSRIKRAYIEFQSPSAFAWRSFFLYHHNFLHLFLMQFMTFVMVLLLLYVAIVYSLTFLLFMVLFVWGLGFSLQANYSPKSFWWRNNRICHFLVNFLVCSCYLSKKLFKQMLSCFVNFEVVTIYSLEQCVN